MSGPVTEAKLPVGADANDGSPPCTVDVDNITVDVH